ncbi:nucleoside/nucleotide kinase family protein [Frondihabitans cladoniiphilus]|uniref:Nucleoside/nucleotide kinase family protein n=1 Tax=Frondihabitans cladoniiphilus TaxID=715785 RepID=A0ABP8VV29_9MICO
MERARRLASAGERRILGITGTPGAGKTTLSTALIDALGGDAVLIGMDGFHFGSTELLRLGRRGRKGAPDTFDTDGYVSLLHRLSRQREGDETIYAPLFDRGLEEPVGSSVPVAAEVRLVVTEGNYLLLESGGWGGVSPLLTESWFVSVDAEERHRRLVARRLSYGHATDAAEAWVTDVDETNAAVVDRTAGRADLVLIFDATHPTPPRSPTRSDATPRSTTATPHTAQGAPE